MQEITASYLSRLKSAAERLPAAEIEAAAEELLRVYRENGTVFTAGNGGSAAAANHFAADYEKNTAPKGNRKPRILSLSANTSSLTAYGNDEGFENTFSGQLEAWIKKGDLLVVISASGNSPNAVKAAELARERGAGVIALTGFAGGRLKELSTVSLHVPADSYEISEDLHMVVCHILVCSVREKLRNT